MCPRSLPPVGLKLQSSRYCTTFSSWRFYISALSYLLACDFSIRCRTCYWGFSVLVFTVSTMALLGDGTLQFYTGTLVLNRGGPAQLFFESAIATPQLEGSTSAIAIPQLFKECCSAIATPQFRNRNFFWSPQLQVRSLRALLPQFSADVWHGVAWNYIFFYHQVFFAIERILKGQ
jgi:hypothetical protein